MSGPSTISNESLPSSSRDPDADDLTRSVKRPVQFVGFWGAIALPFVYLPLLAYGLDGVEITLAFVALVALNLVALIVGHGYETA